LNQIICAGIHNANASQLPWAVGSYPAACGQAAAVHIKANYAAPDRQSKVIYPGKPVASDSSQYAK
jgi:hypothetical protein